MVNIQKLEHLINLANDSGAAEGEARNAALIAVQLIKKHDLFKYIKSGVSCKTEVNYSEPQKKSTKKTYNKSTNKKTYSNEELSFKGIVSDSNIETLAYYCCLETLYYLSKNYNRIISVKEICNIAIRDYIIYPSQVNLFANAVRYVFKTWVSQGKIKSKVGRSGGFFI